VTSDEKSQLDSDEPQRQRARVRDQQKKSMVAAKNPCISKLPFAYSTEVVITVGDNLF
jgi:hypothetical protein